MPDNVEGYSLMYKSETAQEKQLAKEIYDFLTDPNNQHSFFHDVIQTRILQNSKFYKNDMNLRYPLLKSLLNSPLQSVVYREKDK